MSQTVRESPCSVYPITPIKWSSQLADFAGPSHDFSSRFSAQAR